MKVILLQDVKNVGKKNQIVEVSDGYAQNFLIPNKKAVKATTKGVEVRDKQIQDEKDNLKRMEEEAKVLAERLKDIVLEFEANASKDGRMMGSISPKQIADDLKEKYGIVIDKRKFLDKYPCNAFGYTNSNVELFKGVKGIVRVHVSPK